MRLSFSEPLKSILPDAIHLEFMEDSLWNPLDDVEIKADSTGKIMEFELDYRWEFDTQYRLTIDSASVSGIYNRWNDGFKHEFKVKGPEDYSTLIFDISGKSYHPDVPYDWDSLARILFVGDTLQNTTGCPSEYADSLIMDSIVPLSPAFKLDSLTYARDSLEETQILLLPDTLPSIIVQLLASNEQVVAQVPVVNGKARFDFLSPGTYYARAFIDFNGDGKWTTGDITEWRQPEDVFYYPKKIILKQNWDMSQTWNLFELPVDVQKPLEIKKNKPKTKEAPARGDEEEEEDDFGNNYFYQGTSYGNGSQYNNAGRSTRGNTMNGLR